MYSQQQNYILTDSSEQAMDQLSFTAFIVVSLVLWGTSANAQTQDCKSHLENDNSCYCQLLETVQNQWNRLQEICNNLTLHKSCAEIKASLKICPSGYYNISVGEETHTVYCNMDELCNDSGGWMRVGYLNMSDPSEQCPPGFRLYEENGIRSCGRLSVPPYCQSVNFTAFDGVSYTKLCGRVTGYQKATTDAFQEFGPANQRNNIELVYVDGVSITRGSPRKHIWSYAASNIEDKKKCPCDENSTASSPSFFVEEDYFCESAVEMGPVNEVFTNDLLWDGEQCGDIQAACCEASRNMPWFKKVLDAPSTDYIELRVCCDQPLKDEDVGVNYYEIYIK